MKRREFINFTAAGSALAAVSPRRVLAYHDTMAQWRGYRLQYTIQLPQSAAPAQLWLPLPEARDNHHQRVMGAVWTGKPDKVLLKNADSDTVPMFYAGWRGKGPRTVVVSTIVKTTDRRADLSKYVAPGNAALPAEVAPYLKSTRLKPLDGIVKTTALSITKGAKTPIEKARTLYDWVVDNTCREPAVRGCGRGDIKFMLETGNLGGKCADLNALYVGLARAAGIPARDVYGIRVDDSEQFKSLGKSGDVSRAQHCRAEFYLAGFGWVPVDPADVSKAVLEEKLPLDDPKVAALRERLFGYWEMNWVAFNTASDVALNPRPAAGTLPFFMYPHAEIGRTPQDSLEPAAFVYKIEAAELVGTGAKLS